MATDESRRGGRPGACLTHRPPDDAVSGLYYAATAPAIAQRLRTQLRLLCGLLLQDLTRRQGTEKQPLPALHYPLELRTAAPHARVLILTALHDPELHRRAVGLGAAGLVLKEKVPEVLFRAIEKVHAGEAWLERVTIANALDELTSRNGSQLDSEKCKIAALTTREHEVMLLVTQGFKNQQIAKRLFISETTVRHHLTATFHKLAVVDRLELVIYAYRYGLAKLPS